MNNRISSFDVVRGVAILMVFLAHSIHFFPSGINSLDSLIGLGRFGVQLFFILSGASVCMMWEARNNEAHRTLKFYTRRVLRIAPLYWAFIPLSLSFSTDLANHWSPNGVSWVDVILNILLLHAILPSSINSVVPGGWSISVEFFFYLLFPLISIILGRRISLYIALGILIWAANLIIPGLITAQAAKNIFPTCPDYLIRDFLFLSPLNQLPAFLLGCSIFHIYRSQRSRINYFLLFAWTASALLWGFLSGADRAFFCAVYLALGFFALFCFIKGVQNNFLQTVGRNSYALYLCHFLVLSTISSLVNTQPSPLSFLFGCLISFFLSLYSASIIHRWVDPATHALQSRILKAFDSHL